MKCADFYASVTEALPLGAATNVPFSLGEPMCAAVVPVLLEAGPAPAMCADPGCRRTNHPQ